MTLDRDAVRRRAEAATLGPWEWDDLDGDPGLVSRSVIDKEHGEFGTVLAAWPRFVIMGYPTKSGSGFPALDGPDAEFIAHARTDVPALLDALEAAEAQVERLRAQVAESVPRSALVQVGWFHGDGVNVTAFRPNRDGEPAHPEKWSPVYVLRTEGGAS